MLIILPDGKYVVSCQVLLAKKEHFPVGTIYFCVGFDQQGNNGQVWWFGISLRVLIISLWVFVNRKMKTRSGGLEFPRGKPTDRAIVKTLRNKKTDGQIFLPLSLYSWGLFPVGVHIGKLFFYFSVSFLYFPVGMFTLREILVSSSAC